MGTALCDRFTPTCTCPKTLYVHLFVLLFSPPMSSFDPLWDPPLRPASPKYGGRMPNKNGLFWGLNPSFGPQIHYYNHSPMTQAMVIYISKEYINHGGRSWPGPGPKGGGRGKIVARNNVLCRRQRRRRFCFRHTAGGNFFVRPYMFVLKILRISWRIEKWLKGTKKDFDPDPASRSGLG